MTISLRQSASALALSLALVLGACGDKNKGTGPQISAEAAPLGLTKPSEKVFARHFDVPKRDVDEAQAEKALSQLGLAESGSTALTWDKRTGSSGNYVYTNLKSEEDGNVITIGRAELVGAHMDGEWANFDRANFSDLSLTNTEDDIKIDVKAMSVARPSPKAAREIIENLQDLSGDKSDADLSLNIEDGDIDFGAMSLSDIKITGAEVNGNIDQIVYGVEETTGRADFKVEDVNFKILADGITSNFSMGSLSGLEFDTTDVEKGFKAGATQSGLMEMLSNVNIYKKPYESFMLKGMRFDNPYVNVDIPGFSGKAETRGDVTTITQKGEPMVIKLGEAPKNPQSKQLWDILNQLDFNEIKFRASQVTVLDKAKDTVRLKDGFLQMENAFEMNYSYGASGLSALSQLEKDGANAAAEAEVMDTVKLDGLKFSLVDQSIVERGMKLAEQMTGQPPKRMLTGMKGMIAMTQMMAQSDVEKELAAELGTAFIAFAENGGTLTIEFDPSAPIPMSDFMALQNKKGSLKAMGFSATQTD